MKFGKPERTTPESAARSSLEYGWGVSSRVGSTWKSVGVIGSQQQRVYVVVGSCRESLGAIGSHWESLGAVGVNFPTKVPGSCRRDPRPPGVTWATRGPRAPGRVTRAIDLAI